MSIKLPLVLAALAVTPGSSLGDVVIRETGGHYVRGVDYFVVENSFGDEAELIILDSDGIDYPWVVEAYDTATNEPANIEFIGIFPVGPNGPGHIYLIVQRAKDVWEIDLITNRGNSSTTLTGMYCAGNYGAAGALRVGRISGCSITGELLNWIVPTTDISGNISVGKLSSTISAPQSNGSITVTGVGPHAGDIIINSAYARNVTINGQMQGDVTIGGGYSGILTVGTNMLGSVDIAGTFNGSISVGGNLAGDIAVGDSSNNETSGTISVSGNASGNLNLGYAMTGQLTIGGDLSGSIDLKEDMEPQAAIRIDGSIVDSGPNHVRIGRMVAGAYPDPGPEFIVGKQVGNTVTGGNVSLRANSEWFQLGRSYPHSITVNHYGFIKIYGTLASPLIVSGEFRCKVEVGKIDGTDDGAKPTGLLADGNFGSENVGSWLGADITIGEFTRGAIGFVNDTGTTQDPCFLLGKIRVSDELAVPGVGQTSSGDMKAQARITCENAENREIIVVADIQIDGDMEGDIIGTHSINDYAEPYSSGAIAVSGNMTSTASIQVIEVTGPQACAMTDQGPISGTISIGGDMAGEIATMLHSATVEVPGGLRAEIAIGGDLSGTVRSGGDFEGAVDVEGDLVGQVLIDGSLKNGQAAYEIEVTGTAASSAAIAVDYDGFDAGHDWELGAVIRIDGTDYTETSDAVNYLYEAPNLWHIIDCRADCDNDGTIDAFDIEPFTLAISSNPAQYDTNYPGLGGSRVYHADTNCDGTANAFDIDGFIDRQASGSCMCGLLYPRAGGCSVIVMLSIRSSLVSALVGGEACSARHGIDPFDDRAAFMIRLFRENLDVQYHHYIVEHCAFLAAYYLEAGQSRRSEMFMRVSDALRS